MKMAFLIFALLTTNFLLAQADIPENRQYQYSTDTIDYYFYLNSETPQSISWGNVYGYEKCYAHVVNNSGDSILIERVGSRNDPLYWFLDGTSHHDLILPDDTIHFQTKWARRQGPFSRSITLQYRSSSNINVQVFSISTKGTFIDSILIKRQQGLSEEKIKLSEKEKNKQTEFLKHHFKNGQIKQVINKNPEHDSIPTKITYYEDGTFRLKEYKREGVVKEAFDRSGYLRNSWDDKGNLTEYYANGNRKFKSGSDRYSIEEPFQTFYYENGCIQKEIFLNESIVKEYDSLNCNQLIAKTVKDSTVFQNSIAYYADGKIAKINYFPRMGSTQRVEHIGTFEGYRLVDGLANYYSVRNKLLFSSQIVAGKRDAVLSKGERQGSQINLLDEAGHKTGLWIMQNSNNSVPIAIPTDLTKSLSDFRDIAWQNYIYDKGDTATLVYFHDYGGVSSYQYLNDRDKRIRDGKEVGIIYYENGYVKHKAFELKNGLSVVVNYSEDHENEIIGGSKSYGNIYGELVYKGTKLVEIKSRYNAPEMHLEPTVSKRLKQDESVVEKGSFKHFELYNGFIYYYDKHENLNRTEKVVNGVIQGNPRVKLYQEQLFLAGRLNDLNMNGWVEKKELDGLSSISIRLTDEEIESFNWKELAHFKNLVVLNCNGRSYRMSDYQDYASLQSAVENKLGAKIVPRRQRYSWEEPERYDYEFKSPHELTTPAVNNIIVEFPDVDAKFLGGHAAMEEWIDSNMVYPEVESVGSQFRVYVEFVVRSDGSISDVKLLKSVQLELDREAIRLIKTMPNWIPAISQGEVCSSRVRLPITFSSFKKSTSND